jgi:Uncharacterized protein conserved in bacteria (DUF2314)
MLDKAKRDEIVNVPKGDPDMQAAYRKAKAPLKDFLVIARSPRPSITGYAVKVAVYEGDKNEFFWISPFSEKGDPFTGKINNTPPARHAQCQPWAKYNFQGKRNRRLAIPRKRQDGRQLHRLRNHQERASPTGRGPQEAIWNDLRALSAAPKRRLLATSHHRTTAAETS